VNPLAYVVLGLGVGVFSGVVGVGGGIVLVPALVYLFKFPQHVAQGTSLVMLIPPIGLLGAYTYYKHGYVDLRAAGLLIIGFVIGSPLGARVAVSLPQETLRRVVGWVLLAVGARMILGK
jgi:uncharacterized protein